MSLQLKNTYGKPILLTPLFKKIELRLKRCQQKRGIRQENL